jgi:hypothetical protein
VQKSSVFPIQCSEEDKNRVQHELPCQLLDFLCRYLGLPLTLKRLSRVQIQPFIDRIADQLPGWKADLLSKPGRKTLVQYVFTSMLIYLAMAIDIPAWGFRRGFFWRGSADAKGGYCQVACQVAWGKVCRPMELGGLRISSLQELGWALRMRWMWLQKTNPNQP